MEVSRYDGSEFVDCYNFVTISMPKTVYRKYAGWFETEKFQHEKNPRASAYRFYAKDEVEYDRLCNFALDMDEEMRANRRARMIREDAIKDVKRQNKTNNWKQN